MGSVVYSRFCLAKAAESVATHHTVFLLEVLPGACCGGAGRYVKGNGGTKEAAAVPGLCGPIYNSPLTAARPEYDLKQSRFLK